MPSGPRRLLTRHFLRRLIDDDLISPNADRHESLSMICAMLASLGLFVSVIISTRYLFNPYLTPGVASVSALFDHFLFTSAAMTATALVTLLAWDGLAVDARDASVLGAMPIRSAPSWRRSSAPSSASRRCSRPRSTWPRASSRRR